MKRIINILREQLDFSIEEAKGAILATIVIFISILAYYLFSNLSFNKNSTIVIKEYGHTEIPEFKNKEYDFQNKNYDYDKQKFASKGVKFSFDPNTATEADFKKMGFPMYVAKTIFKYRQKGGKFKFKEDLKKIYILKPEIYEEFQPFILLPEKNSFTAKDPDENLNIKIESPVEAPKWTKKATISTKFDINSADTTQLMQVRGIGKVFANRIIKYRDLLGGFNNLSQISETYGIAPEAVDELKKMAFINSGVKKISINKVDKIRHPYLNYNQGKVILEYRKQHGDFKNINDLRSIKILDENTLNKIEPYLTF
ncbi:MAG: helix-hairpin-helix domain-containing protein [Cytophagaceae bacterium]|nr:helix-hairpin-helix domain-containing protein [Cytophagaceae bacterium]